MKFGKEFSSQMVPEWQAAYMDYNQLKTLLKNVLNLQRRNDVSGSNPMSQSRKPSKKLKRKLTLYRAFSGLSVSRRKSSSPRKMEDEVIVVTEVPPPANSDSDGFYQTTFLMTMADTGEVELVFFRKLDEEFNKVLKFYKDKVSEVKAEAEELSKQMDALIALRIKVEFPMMGEFRTNSSINGKKIVPSQDQPEAPSSNETGEVMSHMDAIQEVETGNDDEEEISKRPPLQVLNQVRINVDPETPISTLKNVFGSLMPDLSFSKNELKKAEGRLKQAFVQFHQKLRLLKSYSFLNLLAFSKIMKKYDKVTSRNASKSFMEMVENSYLGNSDEITKLTERVESTIIKHFSNGNRSEGMKVLRPQTKKEKHSVTFFLGLLCGCSIALVAAIIVSIYARNLLENEKGRNQYMENIFPLYSLFGFLVLHMILLSGNIYLWRRFRVNYPFIFGYKEGKRSMGYRELLLVASGLTVLTLAAVLSNLDMEMDPRSESYRALTELVPLGLVTVVLLILFCPFNIIYRQSRYFLIQSAWHCLCAPLYKVTLPDFFLADQLTSQVQAFRCLEFYACYYGWGDFKKRSNTCQDSEIYKIFYVIIAVVPYWSRVLQCLRRLFEEGDYHQFFNALKYASTIVAVVLRTIYSFRRGATWRIMAAASSGVTTVYSTYWDIVMDWGLLNRTSKNPWLRDKLLVANKNVYFIAMVVNILLRLVWMQLILDFQAPFLHRKAMIALVACLEILRRCIWNFFRSNNFTT
ncbi:OLC1v1009620C3 [Oldenlandia corymbosa var. corymbosa]|uniref:OLC1v1009620C3 n=1 Tax=Oldenlandia corymbosa var. corymbosa TaxID=529605 RepID=A0AAV1DSL4_OLDCO|nr:OLC1v1009620C3 [Oldenlandia corymbosa var. corymbosa]